MKKVLFFIPSLGQGGAEKVLVNLVNNMDTSEFDITVQTIFDGGINKQFLNNSVKYKSMFRYQFRGNRVIQKLFSPHILYRFFVRERYDIIVAYLEGVAARIISGCDDENTQIISWIHVEQHTKENATLSFRNYKEALKCYSKFKNIVCVSEHVKKDFLSIFNVDSQLSVLYNTNETEKIIKLSKENIDIAINHDYVNICAIGTLKKSKGFDRLILIIKRLIVENLNVRLYILGIGPLEKKLKNQVEKFGLINNVFFLGYKSNPYKYLSKMDIFTCASYSEGFSTATTESLILGIPVVTVMVSGMKEMLGENNEYGIITKNDDNSLFEGLKSLICNKDKFIYYKYKAKQRGKYFSTENTVKIVEQYLEDI